MTYSKAEIWARLDKILTEAEYDSDDYINQMYFTISIQEPALRVRAIKAAYDRLTEIHNKLLAVLME